MVTREFEAYLSLDASKYQGKWIALCGDEIVAQGRDLRSVHAAASKKCPGKSPLFMKVPDGDETLIL
jgi:hypothetical protein